MSRPKPKPLAAWKLQAFREKLSDPCYIDAAIQKIADDLSDYYVDADSLRGKTVVRVDD